MSRRTKYNSDYAKRVIVDEDGDYVKDTWAYVGKRFRIDAPKERLNKIFTGYAIMCAAIDIIYMGVGFLNNPASRAAYALAPYVLMLLPGLMMPASVYNHFDAERDMTRKQRDRSVKQLKIYTIMAAACGGAAALGTVVYMLIYGFSTGDMLYGAGNAAMGLLSGWFISIQGKYKCIEIGTDEQDGSKPPEEEEAFSENDGESP